GLLLVHLQVFLRELLHRLHGEGAGTHRGLADTPGEAIGCRSNAGLLLEDIYGLTNVVLSDDRRRVEGGRALPIAGGLAEHEGAPAVAQPLLLRLAVAVLLGLREVGVLRQVRFPAGGHYPGALGGIPLRGNLEELLPGDKALVG